MRLSVFLPMFIPTVLILVAVYMATGPAPEPLLDNPWAAMQPRSEGEPHAELIGMSDLSGIDPGDAQALSHRITEKCVGCHEDEAKAFMETSHWTWLGDSYISDAGEEVPIGKLNLLNNICVGIVSNLTECASCHAGYGWADDSFDFADTNNIDCLVCHDRTGTYAKAPNGAGYPAIPGNITAAQHLLTVAQSVGSPTREACDTCHLLSGTEPDVRYDVHMGEHDFACQDCHRVKNHQIQGQSLIVNPDNHNHIGCAGPNGCHSNRPHLQDRLNAHTATLSCQACHIPAVEELTDLGTANLDLQYAERLTPNYRWYNGHGMRHLPGEPVDGEHTVLSAPLGDVSDPRARIYPFKIYSVRQAYDTETHQLLVPHLAGENGLWEIVRQNPDGNREEWWDAAFRAAAEDGGPAYSGSFAWTQTEMAWPLTHTVGRAANALQCAQCHGEDDHPHRIDWVALGYSKDAAYQGGRLQSDLVSEILPPWQEE